MSKFIVAAVSAAFLALGLVQVAEADHAKRRGPRPVATSTTVTLPTAECPGTSYDLRSQTAMFCRESQPARAEGPYYLNYVAEVDGQQMFCQMQRRLATVTTCHPYWPFKNPTVNPHLAPDSAFTQ